MASLQSKLRAFRLRQSPQVTQQFLARRTDPLSQGGAGFASVLVDRANREARQLEFLASLEREERNRIQAQQQAQRTTQEDELRQLRIEQARREASPQAISQQQEQQEREARRVEAQIVSSEQSARASEELTKLRQQQRQESQIDQQELISNQENLEIAQQRLGQLNKLRQDIAAAKSASKGFGTLLLPESLETVDVSGVDFGEFGEFDDPSAVDFNVVDTIEENIADEIVKLNEEVGLLKDRI